MATPKQAPDTSSDLVPAGGIMTATGADGLPAVDERAAAARAAQYIMARGYGANTTELVGYIAIKAVDAADLNVVIIEQLAERLLNAASPDEILTPFDPQKGEAYFGKPIQIESAGFLESDYTEGFPWYVSLQVTVIGSGESAVITVGGEKLVMQVAALDRHDAWPTICKIHRAEKPTKNGFYPLELRPAT